MAHYNEHLQVNFANVCTKGYSVGHSGTHYSFHKIFFNVLIFVCYFLRVGEVTRTKGEYWVRGEDGVHDVKQRIKS